MQVGDTGETGELAMDDSTALLARTEDEEAV